jgi:pimeloyl-ACP methyl ester carboxylesterase
VTEELPAVLLVHGQPGSAADWDGVAKALGGRAQVLTLDRPGWDGHTPAADLEGNVRAVIAQLAAAGVEQAVVVGHSFGGAVACLLAASRPALVRALVLAAPAANVSALLRLDRWLAKPLLGELGSAVGLSGLGLALAAAPLRARIARELVLEEAYLRTVARRLLSPAAWQAFVADQRTLVRELPGLERRLAEIRAPTTILAGELDHVVPLASLRELAAQIPSARLVTVSGTDHLLPMREPRRFAGLVLEACAPPRGWPLG